MSVRFSRLWCLNLLAVAAWGIDVPRFADTRAELPAGIGRPAAQISNVPLVFERAEDGGAFQSRTHQHTLLFRQGAVEMHLGPRAVVTMDFPGAAAKPPRGEQPRGSYTSYLRGTSENWKRKLAHFGRVRYAAVWPGVDLVFYGAQKQLEYDFVVAPGADPDEIRMRFSGADAVAVAADGSLRIEGSEGSMQLKAPVVYQTVDGARRTVEGRYAMLDPHTVAFRIGEYDPALELVIDPILDYSTYLGGSAGDFAFAMAIDAAGNQYLAGRSESPDLLTGNTGTRQRGLTGQSDAFVIKLDPTGSRIVYSTYLGGRDFDVAYGLKVDSAGAAYITGITRSTDFPTRNPVQARLAGVTDAFVSKLTPDGSGLAFSTYLGGADVAHTGGSRGDEGYGIAVDGQGFVYVAGYTPSNDFPVGPNSFRGTYGGAGDGFVVRLRPDGSLDVGLYVGGSAQDGISDIVLTAPGLAYVTGGTQSQDFPVFQAGQSRYGGGINDAFLTLADFTNRRISYSSYLGGSGLEEGFRLAAGRNNDVYVTGYTFSADFPSTPRALSPTHGSPNLLTDSFQGRRPVWDAFIARYVQGSGSWAFARLLGGNGDDLGFGITVDPANRAWVTGLTCSRTFPITPGAYQGIYGGGEADAYVTVFGEDGQIATSTFLGGSGQDEGYQIALDSFGNVYVAGVTFSGDFPVSTFAVQHDTRANGDSFALRVADPLCDVRLTRPRGLISDLGAEVPITVTTSTAGCQWRVSSYFPWIVPDRTSGTGNGTLTLRIVRNTDGDVRTGIVSVNGRRTFVHQSGTNRCALKLTPSAVGLPPSSERRTIAVRAQQDDCAWRAVSNSPWLRIVAGAAGSGNGAVTYVAERNRTPQARTGSINIGDRRVNVTQEASECRISLSSAAGQSNNAGGLGSVIVATSTEDCAWTAVSRTPAVLTILSGASGIGNGRVRFSMGQNNTGQERQGIIDISGTEFVVPQTNRFLNSYDQTILSSAGANPFNESAPASDKSRAAVANCGFTIPGQRFQLDAAGRAVEVAMTRGFDGCPVSTGPPDLGFISAQIRNNGSRNPVLVLTAQSNPGRNQRTARFLMTPGAGSPSFVVTVDQSGAVATTLDLNPSDRIQLPAVATTGSVEVTSDEPECTWDAQSPESWLKLRDNNGPCAAGIDFDAQANNSASPRTARIVFSTGQEIEVEQRGVRVDCNYAFATGAVDFPVDGGARSVNVQTTAGCTWFASVDKEEWISFPAGQTGSGPAALQLRAAANDLPGERIASVTIGGAQLIVRQQGAPPPPPCEFTLDPASRSFAAAGGAGSFRVNTTAECTWRAATAADWIRITSGETGTGSGDVSFEVTANPEGGVSRSAEISVEGVTFRVTQEGAAVVCTYTLNPESRNFAAAGGGGSFRVNTQAGCVWAAFTNADWIIINNGGGTGSGDVTFQVRANPSGSAARSAEITVEGRVFRVTQEPADPTPGCTYTLTPTSRDFPLAGGAATFRVNAGAGCNWTATANVPWIRVLVGASGSGNGEVAFEVQANTGAARSGEINVQGVAFRVTQAGVAPPPGCTYSVSPTSTTFPAAGGEGTFRVNTTAGCEWTASPAATWITVVSGQSGSGSGEVRFRVAANTSGSRSADIRVQTQLFRVTQEAGSPGGGGESTITASPNPITQCEANGLGITTLTWRSTEPAPLQIRIGSPTGAVFGDVESQGSGTTGDWVTDGMTFYLMKDGRTLAQVRVTLACPRPVGQGSIQASPTAVPVCDPPGTGTTVLNWNTVNVTNVEIRRDRFDGALVTQGGPSGSFNAQVSFDTTFLLVDVSGGRAPSEAGVLSSVRVTRAPCDRPIGIAPPAGDLVENNFGSWDLQFPFNSNAVERRNNTAQVISGDSSILFSANSGVTAISMRLRAPASRVWDFSTIRQIAFSLRTSMAASNWRAGSPSIELISANGTRRILPTINIAGPASQDWYEVRAPLATASSWNVVDEGNFDIRAVSSFRIVFETLGASYQLLVDGMFLRP